MLQREGGLGLATGPSFDGLRLEPVGEALGEIVLSQRAWGKVTLARWLERWLRADPDLPRISDALYTALSPQLPTPGERGIVRARVLGIATDACEKRRRLERAVGTAQACPDIREVVIPRLEGSGRVQQAREVRAAMAFGALLNGSRALAAAATNAIAPTPRGLALAVLARDAAVERASGRLQRAAAEFLARAADAGVEERSTAAYGRSLVDAPSAQVVVERVVTRAPKLFAHVGGQMMRGPLFRVLGGRGDDASEDVPTEPDRVGGTFRIANFHALLHDLKAEAG